ncbi:MAG: polysaccharide biosynthesis protein [Clostridiales Family XIII bacterium]|nr:polysaccharide biosynthesis protein [Clostridiales Family XIII bacterium]
MRSKALRILIIVLVDCAIVAASEAIPLLLRFGIFSVNAAYLDRMLVCLPVDMAIAFGVLAFFKLYTRVWSFAGIDELFAALKASLVIEAVFIVYRIGFAIPMPRSFYLFQWIILFLLLGGSRLFVRLYRQILKRNHPQGKLKRIMIVGAGSAASILIQEFKYQKADSAVLCIVDDNPDKLNKYIAGIKIEGDRFCIPELCEKYAIEEIVIAIPSASAAAIHEIIDIAGKTDARLKILPSYVSQAPASSFARSIRDVNYEDLLGRNTVDIVGEGLQQFLDGKTVMVTGGGGSIGSELCRQIAANRPGRLIIIDIYENTVHDLAAELSRHFPGVDMVSLIASVRDEARLRSIFEEYRPDVIYHAAAHKHVPLMEGSPCEAVKNNCGGTLTLARLADEYGVGDFVLISTDKAVRPTNVMGATKRICELIVQTVGRASKTRFVAVRFGNVLGSNGSVIPLFLRQIEEGGPVTVTHREVTRFFMTISEAVSLVLQASLLRGAGELFILDMSEPVKIYDLAANLIKLRGLKPGKDIEIRITGLRPGEKLYEELLMAEEGLDSTMNDLIFVGKPTEIDAAAFFEKLDRLLAAAEENAGDIKEEIAKVCDTYRPAQ